jgi:hypothetical protein
MSALYIGACWDTRFLKILDCKQFIHIDPSPNSNGTGYGDKIFIDTLVNKLKKVNYYLTKNSYEKLKDLGENKTFLEFENNEENTVKSLKYYVNTWFPQDIDKIPNLKQEIYNIDTLIIEGFNPSSEIIHLIKNPINLVLGEHTYYGEDTYEGTFINYLYKNKDSKNIKSMYLYRKKYEELKFNDIKEVHLVTKL